MRWPGKIFLTTALLLGTLAINSVAYAKLIVILDPGHGGEDTGAIKNLGRGRIAEKDLTLALALRTAHLLRMHGVSVTLTRAYDRFMPLDRRTAMANRLIE